MIDLLGFEYINDEDMARDQEIRNRLIRDKRRELRTLRRWIADMQVIYLYFLLKIGGWK